MWVAIRYYFLKRVLEILIGGMVIFTTTNFPDGGGVSAFDSFLASYAFTMISWYWFSTALFEWFCITGSPRQMAAVSGVLFFVHFFIIIVFLGVRIGTFWGTIFYVLPGVLVVWFLSLKVRPGHRPEPD